MSEVSGLAPEVGEQIFDLLRDEAQPAQPFSVQYQGFFITADGLQTLARSNAATYQLRRGSAEAGQWAARYPVVRVLLRQVGAKLEQAFQYPHGWRSVVYDLGSAWQTDTEVLIGFRMLSGSAGRNRWFGRRDGKVETRTPPAMDQLAQRLRQELTQLFAAQNPPTDLGLPHQWLTVARLPLAAPTTLLATAETKTRLLRQLSQALVVGEVLRRVSFDDTPAEPPTAIRPMPYPLNQILYGPPGTGKTHSTTAWALALLNPNNLSVADVVAHYGPHSGAMRPAFDHYRQLGQVGFVSFHQSFGYEDFVEGIKPGLSETEEGDDTATSLSYRIEAGIFKAMAERAIYGLHVQRQVRLATSGVVQPAVALDFDTGFALFSTHLQELLATAAPGTVRFPTKSKYAGSAG